MLKGRTAFVVLAICLALIADSSGQSQRPSPRSRESVQPPISETANPAHPSASDQRGTEHSPVIVKVLPSDDEKQKAAAEAKREEQKAANDESLANFTERLFWATVALSFIAACQLFVFGWQGIQLKRAVDLANREFIASHRPRIVIREPKILLARGKDNTPIINYVLENCGETGAHIVESALEDVFIEGGIPDLPNFTVSRKDIPETYLEPGKDIRLPFKSARQCGDRDMLANENGETNYYFVGRIAFVDDLGGRRQMGFCRRFNIHVQRFRVIPGCEEEYYND